MKTTTHNHPHINASIALRMPLFLTLFALVFAVSSCKKSGIFCDKAEGAIVTETLDMPEITAAHSCIDANIIFTYNEGHSVTVTAQQSVIDNLTRDVKDGEWNIDFDKCMRQHEQITIEIGTPTLTGIAISGSGSAWTENHYPGQGNIDLKISGSGDITVDAEAAHLITKISGSGDIALIGSAVSNNIKISGSGDIRAYEMPTDDVTTKISGSGNIEVYANDKLDATISGSGSVFYKGHPSVSTSITGSGEVVDMN